MNEIVKYKKPELAKLEECKKLRDYEETILNTLCRELIAFLLKLLAVNDGKTEHHNAMFEHVKNCYGMYSFEEIKKAFDFYLAGKFQIKPYQVLNAVVFGQVMREYEFYKKENLKEYRRRMNEFKNEAKPMSEEEIDAYMQPLMEEAIVKYQKDGIIETPTSKYDYLAKKGIIQKALGKEGKEFDEYKRQKYKLLQEILVKDWSKKKATTRQDKIDIKNTVKDLQTGKSGKIIVACKESILTEYFNTIKNK